MKTLAALALTIFINADHGGNIDTYVGRYMDIRDAGHKVVVNGTCASACTLVLGLIPEDRLCATRSARFGFHQARYPDGSLSALGTARLEQIWPRSVLRIVSPLTPDMHYYSAERLGIRLCR